MNETQADEMLRLLRQIVDNTDGTQALLIDVQGDLSGIRTTLEGWSDYVENVDANAYSAAGSLSEIQSRVADLRTDMGRTAQASSDAADATADVVGEVSGIYGLLRGALEEIQKTLTSIKRNIN